MKAVATAIQLFFGCVSPALQPHFSRTSAELQPRFSRASAELQLLFTRVSHTFQLTFSCVLTHLLLSFTRSFTSLYPHVYRHSTAQSALHLSHFTRASVPHDGQARGSRSKSDYSVPYVNVPSQLCGWHGSPSPPPSPRASPGPRVGLACVRVRIPGWGGEAPG